MALDKRAQQVFAYFKKYNYEVKQAGDVIRFVGNYKASRGQAAALTFYVFMGKHRVNHSLSVHWMADRQSSIITAILKLCMCCQRAWEHGISSQHRSTFWWQLLVWLDGIEPPGRNLLLAQRLTTGGVRGMV